MSNIILGSDGIAIRQGIYEESVDAKTDLGRFVDFQDGRRFRYCKCNGTAGITKGLMVQAEVLNGDHDNVVQTNYGLSVGDKDNLSVALDGDPTANEYADGYLLVNDGTSQGEGQMYKIRKNTAAHAPCKIWLYDKIVTAIAAAADITLVKNRYLDVCVAVSTTVENIPIGVPLITVTTAYYFWAQTRGYCPLLVASSGTMVTGNDVGAGATAGGCVVWTACTTVYYGKCVYAAADSDYAVVDLKLE